MEQKASIGRIIHVVRNGESEHTPGIINGVHSTDPVKATIGAMIFPYNGAPIQINTIEYGEDGRDNTWHWPERI